MNESKNDTVPPWLVMSVLAGAAVALLGGYWDDAWHTERGRDDFFIAPHLAIYGGVGAVGGAIAARLATIVRAAGIRSLASQPALALAAVAVLVTLASGPIDNAWHVAFGRDAVLWSPPHMLGIVGTLALGASLLPVRGRAAPALGGLVLAAATFPVAEYDTDVPQFDAVWYLPALTLGATVALALVRLTSTSRWSAARAAAFHLAFMVLVGAVLVLLGFNAPALPLLLPAAALLDLFQRRGAPIAVQAAVVAGAVYAAYVPGRNLLGDGVSIDGWDVLIGLPLATLAALVVLALAAPRPVPRLPVPAATVVAAALAILLLPAAVARAHDPGQGDPAGTVALTVTAADGRATVRGRVNGTCGGIDGRAIVARRAGRELRAPLEIRGCSFAGVVPLPERGRWFVYVELERGGRRIESWLPVRRGSAPVTVEDAARYAYEPARRSSGLVQAAGGVLLYLLMGAVIAATFRMLRQDRMSRAPQPRPA